MTGYSDASEQPLRFRWRPDLESQRRSLGGKRRWVVRDPLTRRHFQFLEEEFALARLLDGRRSLRDIERAFLVQWPLHRFSAARFQAFLSRLHRDGLLLDDSPGHARIIEQRRDQRQRWRWLQFPASLLALRFPGVNPRRFLDATYPYVRWCFAPTVMLANLVLMLVALSIIVLHPFEFHARLPDLDAWLRPRHLWLVAAVLTGTKVLHELGHAFTCRHYGGECRELGVMLLVLTPCLYCDVGDSWMLSNRWRRMAVAGAGMYVDATLGALATLVWWYSQPGWLNQVALIVMGVCGLSTFLFNGNPLLRYDGYFLLADLCDVPNLWQRSRDALQSMLGNWLLGTTSREQHAARHTEQFWLGLYGVASTVYRLFVLVGCLWFVMELMKSWHVERLGWVFVATTLSASLVPLGTLGWNRWRNPAWRRTVRPGRVRLTLLVGVALVSAAVFVPLPTRVAGPALLQVESATPLYVTVPGTIASALSPGSQVRAGDVVVELKNEELRRELVRWEGDLSALEARVTYLESIRGEDPDASARLPAAIEALAATRDVVEQRRRDLARLDLKAGNNGTLLAPPAVIASDPSRAGSDPSQLPTWSGTPLDPENRGALLENGILVGWIGDPARREAIVFVAEREIERVTIGQEVRLSFAPWPTRVWKGQVTAVAPSESPTLPRELALANDTAFRMDVHGEAKPLETMYQVRVALSDMDLPPLNRVRGEARIRVAPQSLAARLLRSLRQTFVWAP